MPHAGLFREMYDAAARGQFVPETRELVRGTTPLETTLQAMLG